MNILQSIIGQLRLGPRSTGELAAVLGLSPSSITRAIATEPLIIQMGRARAARYGLLEVLRDLPAQQHAIYRIDRQGNPVQIGAISAIVGMGDGFWYEDHENPADSAAYPSLPWFLQDLRPQGFLGRATVRRFAALGWPSRLDLWSERAVLASMLHSPAHDHIGNLLVGAQALAAYTLSRHPLHSGLPEDVDARIGRYRDMVREMGDGAVGGGTSVAGEQPKFCAEVTVAGSRVLRHVLVKFSAAHDTEAGRRWSDLLVMEERCLNSIRNDLDIPAATAIWHSDGERAYLEIDRFDRTETDGRQGVISFASLDAEFVGLGENWLRVAERLVANGHLEASSINPLLLLEFYAPLVGNTDRHLGNLSAHFNGMRPMALTPIYDFLPMRYAPTSTGMSSAALDRGVLDLQRGSSLDADGQRRARDAAQRFWRGCSDDSRISDGMRSVCRENAEIVGGCDLTRSSADG